MELRGRPGGAQTFGDTDARETLEAGAPTLQGTGSKPTNRPNGMQRSQVPTSARAGGVVSNVVLMDGSFAAFRMGRDLSASPAALAGLQAEAFLFML